MNRKAQTAGVGAIIIAFVAVIVGLAMYSGGIAPSIGDSTLTRSVVNETLTGDSGSNITLTGQAATNFVLLNSSNSTLPASNYSVENYVILSDGTLGSRVRILGGADVSATQKATYTYEPLGYAKEDGTRSMIGLIAIFSALAIVVGAIGVGIKNALDNFS